MVDAVKRLRDLPGLASALQHQVCAAVNKGGPGWGAGQSQLTLPRRCRRAAAGSDRAGLRGCGVCHCRQVVPSVMGPHHPPAMRSPLRPIAPKLAVSGFDDGAGQAMGQAGGGAIGEPAHHNSGASLTVSGCEQPSLRANTIHDFSNTPGNWF